MDENYRHCEALVRTADKDRYLATLFAPADMRGPLFALYALRHEISTVRDRAREPMPGEIRLQWWRDVLNGERAGEAPANPVAAALVATIARFRLPVTPLLDLIEAHAFDLYDDPVPSLTALEGYGRQTEAAVLGLAARILGGDDRGDNGPITLVSENAGIAWTITTILRSFGRDASRRQVFLPADLLEQRGIRTEHVVAGQTTTELREVLAALRAHTRDHFARFENVLPQMGRAAMPAFLPVALVPGYLAAMERPDYDPFRSDPSVAQWRRQWTLWRAARRYARMMRS
jgi:phytoene synthase